MQNFHLSQCFVFFYFKILKETFNAHFQVHQLILGSFWVTTRIHLHASVLKKNHTHFLILCSAAALHSPVSETLCFSSRLFKAPSWIPSLL